VVGTAKTKAVCAKLIEGDVYFTCHRKDSGPLPNLYVIGVNQGDMGKLEEALENWA
jgi:hypothetical protein